MKKDISFTPVTGIYVTIARRINELNEPEWHVYLINRNETAITNVFVTSKGYSGDDAKKKEEQQRTSTLRHYFTEIESGKSVIIEPIMPDVFHLNNEYWVSYYVGSQIFDKKFIFVPDTIVDENLVDIEELGLQGVLHE
ncbi:hypothetical protein [Runella sp.]|uniref:hypothetical protein n=1 Tax=Runella sp. TaxID=1960881 RepID=UPI003D134845